MFPAITAKQNSSFKVQPPPVKALNLPLEKVKVVRTAYYTPDRKQKFFLHGSYEEEVRINGKGITFSGLKASIELVSADLKIFPLGTILRIPDHGIVTVADKGKSIKGKRIDVFTGEGEKGLARAIELGKEEVEIEVIKRGGQ